MAIHNTGSDAANTAVRAFLTRVGERYLGHGFNTGSGKGNQIWEDTKDSFEGRCAYCGLASPEGLQREHLVSLISNPVASIIPGMLSHVAEAVIRDEKWTGKSWRGRIILRISLVNKVIQLTSYKNARNGFLNT